MTDFSMPPGNMSGGGSTGKTDRDKIIDAFMSLLAERPFERIGLAAIAQSAGVSLAQLRTEFPSQLAILATHVKEIDRKVLAGDDADMAEESVREKLFDVLMRRLEALAPYKPAVKSLMRSSLRNPGLGFVLNGLAVRSQRWMLTAAGIDVSGPKGAMRAQGLTMLFACVMREWVNDEDPGLARTMAVLDRELSRGQRWSGFLDDLCCIPDRLCRLRPSRTRRHRGEPDEIIAA